MCICINRYAYVFECAHIYVDIHVQYIHLCKPMHIIALHAHTRLYICLCIFVYIHVYNYIRVYIYI